MTSLGQILKRMFFWSYERGTWQYDVAVVLILIFVLVTPKPWFRDQPQVGLPAAPGQVELESVSDGGRREVYRVDARILAPPALKKTLPDLSNGRFSIAKIEPVRDDKGTVIAYEVEIRH